MPPGYCGFITTNDNKYLCLLFFSYSPTKNELLGCAIHETVPEIIDAILDAIPGAYIKFYTDTPITYENDNVIFTTRPATCPMMHLAAKLIRYPENMRKRILNDQAYLTKITQEMNRDLK